MIGIEFLRDLALVLGVAAAAGWICQRLQIPVVFGYLIAGVVVGPSTPTLAAIQDQGRIQAFAQVGLVMVMFAIGLRLSVRKLRRMGVGIFAAVLGGSLLVYYLARLLGASLGLEGMGIMFFAMMLMISSSTVISKVLQERGMTHERVGQLALAVTLLEGVVAIFGLTLLNSYVQFGGARGRAPFGEILGEFSAFIVLAGILGLLLVPWLLRRMTTVVGEELQTVSLAALLFALAIVARYAGYSFALGAFLLGSIVAETPHRHQVERKFEGLREVFGAVFFVAIGMQVELRLLMDQAATIVGVTVFVLVARTVGIAVGLTLVGTASKDALRVGMMVTPLGEFSFIIAQVGVTALYLPPSFFPLAVGVALLTSLAAPWLTQYSERLAEGVVRQVPSWLEDWLRHYHAWIERLQARRKRNLLWQLSKKRVVQVTVGVLLVSGLLMFSERMLGVYTRLVGREFLVTDAWVISFWVILSLVALAPLIAIWRNVSAMALLYSQVATQGMPRKAKVRPLLETTLKTVAGAAMFVWLSSLLPSHGAGKWLVLVSAGVAVVSILVLRSKLIHWHSELEVELNDVLARGSLGLSGAHTNWLRPHVDWNLQLGECVLPDLAECQGRRIAELELRSRFGCTVVGIERQGYMMTLPPPDSVLYPRDKVLLLGTSAQVAAGKSALIQVGEQASPASEFDEIRMELIAVPSWSRAVGHSLLEISPASVHHVQVAGIYREGVRILTPGAEEIVRAEDELLTLGAPDHLREFKSWLQEDPSAEAVDQAVVE